MAKKTPSILSLTQQKLFKALTREPAITGSFYLTGGTALAEFYLQHRYSEDLDFFSEHEVDTRSIFVTLKKIQSPVGIITIDHEQSFNRNLFFLCIGDEIVKTEFTFFPFPRIEEGMRVGSLPIDSLIDIAVNKLFTIYQKPRSRDFIDLYIILKKKKWKINELIRKAKVKFDWHVDPIQLGAQFMQATAIKDYPRMIVKVEPKIWQKFFVNEAKKLKKEIFE